MAQIISGNSKDLGGFSVTRILPSKQLRTVGPFVFFDHMGPADFPAGSGINVRPHPHIGLATISYLFSGSMLHRDSLGTIQEIFPGDVNLMTAGHGIVHSERETHEVRSKAHSLDGIQAWIALPEDKTAIEPSFIHLNKHSLPVVYRDNLMIRIIMGAAYGRVVPAAVYSPMFYVDVIAGQGAKLAPPSLSENECAIYVVSGSVAIGELTISAGEFALLDVTDTKLIALENARYLLLGGHALPKKPILYWNFLAYHQEDIDEARVRWQANGFPPIPGDNDEYIPLPT